MLILLPQILIFYCLSHLGKKELNSSVSVLRQICTSAQADDKWYLPYAAMRHEATISSGGRRAQKNDSHLQPRLQSSLKESFSKTNGEEVQGTWHGAKGEL